MAEVPMRRLMWATVAGIAILAAAAIVWDVTRDAPGTVPHPEIGVAAVRGKSWVAHLQGDVKTTPLGRQGGTAPPPASTAGREPLGDGFHLTGADLYRLECQSCHGPDGKGAPPDINSLIGPVSATRPGLMKGRLAKTGKTLPDKMLEQMAHQARAIIVHRLKHGGTAMPAFGYLDAREIAALLDYLQRLVGPVARAPVTLHVPELRVGALVVRGTCHICHDATGPGGHRVALAGGVPSLASFPEAYSLREIVGKVRSGIPPTGGPMGRRGMGRGMGHGMGGAMMAPAGGWTMPLLPYLTPNEITAAVDYLKRVPPEK